MDLIRSFHNPTGATLPIRTRREVLSLAQRYRVPIVEDATYRDLYFNEEPPPSLRELDKPKASLCRCVFLPSC